MEFRSTPQVYIRVFSIKGLPADIIRKYPKGKVSIQSEITQKKIETKPISFGGKVNLNEVTWSVSDGVLKWDISEAEVRDIKALQPRIKLNIIMHNETSTQAIPTGFITIDIRDLMAEINQKWFKINGMNGAEILISAKLNTPINIGPGNIAGVSSESLASVLHLANQEGIESEEYDPDEDRFTVSIDLEACRSLYLITLQKKEEDKETMKYSSLPTEEQRSFWLCWTLFDDEKAFRSEEFSASQQGPRPMRHKITVGCSMTDFLNRIDSAFPLRIFLCTQGDILGAAEIPLSVPQSGNYGNFPLKNSGWFIMKPTKQKSEWTGAMETDLPAIQISVKVDCVNRSNYQAEYADEFEQDEETSKEIIQKLSAVSDSPSAARVTFNIDDIVKDPNEGKTSTVETNTDPETSGEEEDEDVHPYQNDDEEKDTYMRHFRISVEVKSVGGFKRPAHVAVHFAYPHLGASAPVRTHPIWVLPNTESRIDGASASYDCCMSREHLREIFAQHPLKISTMSRSQIGYSAMGEIHIDFSHVMESKSHSYRCPITGKTFKSLKEYSKHRQIFNALRIAGRVERAPPPEPVVINVIDSYITIMKSTEDSKAETSTVGSGSKMRVVIIIEDIGLVGQQMAIPVKPGYKMQNGGLYNIDHNVQYQDTAKGSSDAGLPPDPLERNDLTEQQRAHLEALRIDWEGWRRAAENQWKEVLREREVELRRRLEAESSASLAQRADDLRRAHEEAGRLEVRLRAAIDSVERQKSQWSLKEEQSQMKLAQKAAELQLLQRRVRDEAKIRIETETRRADSLETQLKTMTDAFHMMEKRAKEAERDFENYRTQSRSSPENVLREEAARLRAQLAEVRTEIERERRLRSETELEKEHFRSQMHRLAVALKREREKNSAMARQELEQLRLEFLAREERYILDGDREELRNIRNELATMKSVAYGGAIAPPPAPSAKHIPSPVMFDDYLTNKNTAMQQAAETPISILKRQLTDLMGTGRYGESDPVIIELQQAILRQET